MELDIKLDPQSRHVHLPVSINNSGPYFFTLDTGAVATTVTPKLLEKLGIKSYDEGLADIKKPDIPYKIAKLPKLTIGSEAIENEEVMVVDIRSFIRGGAGDLHSVLGHTTLKNYVMTLNYKTGKFKLTKSIEKPDIDWLPFDYLDWTHLITIPITINGQGPYPFVLDTGAGGTVVTFDFAEKLGLEETGRVKVMAKGIGGTSPAFMSYVDEFASPSLKLNNFRLIAMDLDKASKRPGVIKYGVLGYNFLQHFELIIDYPNKLIAMIPQDF
jgi:predicted aspartyl protease